jgi:hypothetical protein
LEFTTFETWEKYFRSAAKSDKYLLFSQHMQNLEIQRKPELMLRGTIDVVRASLIYAHIDRKEISSFLNMQRYNPTEALDSCYIFTFDLGGKAFARILADGSLIYPDLADIYNHPWNDLKRVGYRCVWISRTDGLPLTTKELKDLETEVTDDLRFDYAEDEVGFWFDSGLDPSYLFASVYDIVDCKQEG